MIRSAIATIVMLTLTLAGWSIWRQLDQPVRAVRVEGALSTAEQAAIREVVVRSLKQGLLSLDVADLSRRIRDLSWPRSVAVRRVWPDALVIRVEKESVVAAWGDGGYLTSAGKIVQLAGAEHDVPELATDLSEPRRAMEVYQMLASRLSPAGFSVVRLEENRLGEWLMTLEGGMTVALGNQSVNQRLERFLLAHRQLTAQRNDEIVHVDLRYDSGLAVQWADQATSVGATSAGATSAGATSAGATSVGATSRSRPGGRSHSSDQEAEYALR